jgi:hypothetical protein
VLWSERNLGRRKPERSSNGRSVKQGVLVCVYVCRVVVMRYCVRFDCFDSFLLIRTELKATTTFFGSSNPLIKVV